MTEDERLILRIQRFDSESAKDTLIRKYYDHIYAYAYRRTLHTEDALDITQEIFIKAIRALPHFDRRKAAFSTWLYRIAANCLSDHFRTHRVLDKLPEDLPDAAHFEEIAMNQAAAVRILDFLKENDYRAWQIVELKIFAGLTFDEIGKMLSLPSGTVKTRYYAAIGKCRKEFSDD